MLETTCINVQVRCASARRTLHFRKGALGIGTCEKSLSLRLFLPLTCPSVNWTTLVSHIGHSLESVIAVACNFSPCEPHQNKLCTSSATPAPCDSKKNSVHLFSSFRPTSVLLRFVCFLLSHSSAPVSCTDHIEIKGAKKGRNAKRNLPQVFLEFTSSSPSSDFLQALMSSSVARHSRALVHTCLLQNRR